MFRKKMLFILLFALTSISFFTACTRQTNDNKKAGTLSNPEQTIKNPKDLSDKTIFADTMVEMTWQQVQQEADKKAVVLFPIAVVEEHGPHLDLSPDIYLTYTMCKLMKQSLEKKGIHAIIAPPYYWGINISTGGFPGSFNVKPETFKAVLYDTIECLKKWGFTQVFYINFHGDPIHRSVLQSSASELRPSLGIDVVDLGSLNISVKNAPSFPAAREGKYVPDYHGGADETASMWAYYPDKVNVEVAKKLKPQSNFSPLGYVGDPANFDLEDGKKMHGIIAEREALKVEAYIKQQKK